MLIKINQTTPTITVELDLNEATHLINDIDAFIYRDMHYIDDVYAVGEFSVLTSFRHEVIEKLHKFMIQPAKISFYFTETRKAYKTGEYNENRS